MIMITMLEMMLMMNLIYGGYICILGDKVEHRAAGGTLREILILRGETKKNNIKYREKHRNSARVSVLTEANYGRGSNVGEIKHRINKKFRIQFQRKEY